MPFRNVHLASLLKVLKKNFQYSFTSSESCKGLSRVEFHYIPFGRVYAVLRLRRTLALIVYVFIERVSTNLDDLSVSTKYRKTIRSLEANNFQ